MTFKEKFLAACTAGFFLLLVILSVFAAREHRALAAASKSAAQSQKQINADKSLIVTLDQKLQKRQKDFDQQRRAYESQIASIKDRDSALAALRKNAPEIAAGVGRTGACSQETADAKARPQVPDVQQPQAPQPKSPQPQPGAITLSGPAFIALSKQLAQCRLDQAALGKCNADAADLHAELAAAQDSQKRTEHQRDTWKHTAQGGTFVHKTIKTGILAGCGALGAAAGNATRHGDAVHIGIGAVVGVVVCALIHK